jgi:hypothetical protein
MAESITNADILDAVRRLRSYMSTLDNCHQVLENMKYIGDAAISSSIYALMPEVIDTSKKISATLKLIETGRQYRDMLKTYNMDEDDQ